MCEKNPDLFLVKLIKLNFSYDYDKEQLPEISVLESDAEKTNDPYKDLDPTKEINDSKPVENHNLHGTGWERVIFQYEVEIPCLCEPSDDEGEPGQVPAYKNRKRVARVGAQIELQAGRRQLEVEAECAVFHIEVEADARAGRRTLFNLSWIEALE